MQNTLDKKGLQNPDGKKGYGYGHCCYAVTDDKKIIQNKLSCIKRNYKTPLQDARQ